jgi:hypothetical protein
MTTPKKLASPLFTNFLTLKAFLGLYFGGIAVYVFSYFSLDPEWFTESIPVTTLAFCIIAPLILFVVRKIHTDITRLFELEPSITIEWKKQAGIPQSEISYLFQGRSEFKRFKEAVFALLKNRKSESLFLAIFLVIGGPLAINLEYQRGILQILANNIFSLGFIAYVSWVVYWVLVYLLLLSVGWMMVAILRALYKLNKEKPNLHITNTIDELRKMCALPKDSIDKNKIDLLDIALRRFKAGLEPLAGFALSLSLLFAFIGGVFSTYTIITFAITHNHNFMLYGVTAVWNTIGISFFVLGQFGVWKLWVSAKKDANDILNCICLQKTETKHSLNLSPASKTKENMTEISQIYKTCESINQLSPVTYTSSSIYKIVVAYALAFGPIIIDELIKFTVFK